MSVAKIAHILVSKVPPESVLAAKQLWPKQDHCTHIVTAETTTKNHMGNFSWRPRGTCTQLQCTWEMRHSKSFLSMAHLRVGACFPFLEVFMAASLIQLGPKGFGFPVIKLGLELVVESPVVLGLQLQIVAELLEGLESPFAGCGLDKAVKEDMCLVHLLVAPLLHTSSLAARPPCFGGSCSPSSPPAFLAATLLINNRFF